MCVCACVLCIGSQVFHFSCRTRLDHTSPNKGGGVREKFVASVGSNPQLLCPESWPLSQTHVHIIKKENVCLFSELNLAVAAYISDSVIDEVIDKLSDNHKSLVRSISLFCLPPSPCNGCLTTPLFGQAKILCQLIRLCVCVCVCACVRACVCDCVCVHVCVVYTLMTAVVSSPRYVNPRFLTRDKQSIKRTKPQITIMLRLKSQCCCCSRGVVWWWWAAVTAWEWNLLQISNFLERLDKRTGCTFKETVAVV